MRILRQRAAEKIRRREHLRNSVRERLRDVLPRFLPAHDIWLFGSVTRVGEFHIRSDVDLAVDSLPAGISQYGLIARLEEEMGRPVDVLLLGETRLRSKIVEGGEKWSV